MTILLWQFVWLPLMLFVLYPLAIQFERGGWWRALAPLYYPAGMLDVYLNYTTLALYTYDFPARAEWTFSTRLKRLQFYPGWRGQIARVIRDYLNFWQRGHV